MKSPPFESPLALQEKMERALRNLQCPEAELETIRGGPAEVSIEDMAEDMQVPGSCAAGSLLFSFLGNKHAAAVFAPDREMAAGEIEIENLAASKGRGRRSGRSAVIGPAGRYLGGEPIRPGEKNYRIAVGATLRQAAARSVREERGSEESAVNDEDCRKKRLEKPLERLIVFVVDASGSMGSGMRVPMKAAKGAVLAILRKEHPSRSKVAMIAFGGHSATLVLPPTSSMTVAESALEHLQSGGGTPFGDSLKKAWQLVRSEKMKNPGLRPILVVISDGEANVPIAPEAEPLEELTLLAERVARDQIPAIFIDAGAQKAGQGEMQRIAGVMHASYLGIDDLSAVSVLKAVLNHK